MSGPGLALASTIACCNEPAPLVFVLVTVKVIGAGAAVSGLRLSKRKNALARSSCENCEREFLLAEPLESLATIALQFAAANKLLLVRPLLAAIGREQ